MPKKNVQNQPREWLEVVYADWFACENPAENPDDFDQKKYNTALKRAKTMPEDVLADFIWEKMFEYATCTNGGWAAYACPYGCGCHLISFDRENMEE